MADIAPDDHTTVGALPHEPGCHRCAHRWHLLPCECGCADHTTPGLD